MFWQRNIFSRKLSPDPHRVSHPREKKCGVSSLEGISHIGIEWEIDDCFVGFVGVLNLGTVNLQLLQSAMDEIFIGHRLVHIIVVDTIDGLDLLLSSFLIQLQSTRSSWLSARDWRDLDG